MFRRAAAICVATLIAGIALAQSDEEVRATLAIDLNRDGLNDTFTLEPNGESTYDLRITNTGASAITASGIASRGVGADMPLLGTDGLGRVQVTSFHDAEGDVRWTLTLTIGFPDGSYRVVGYRFVWWNAFDPNKLGYCDLDLRSAVGHVQSGSNDAYEVLVDVPALPVTLWNETEKLLPVDCN